MTAYYNEIDPFAAQWLRNLIAKNLIAPGDVDERSIVDVQPDEVRGYTQCHFFAGIGGWSYALRLAEWTDDKPVWTGSCPCQPFSVAGRGRGDTDRRHLWPVWVRLICHCRPSVIFGEQVARAIAFGWLDYVYQGLEAEGYAIGSAVLPACGVGAPHKRERLFFVGDSKHNGRTALARNRSVEEPVFNNKEKQDCPGQSERTGTSSAFSDGVEWKKFPDGNSRITKSGLQLLAHGLSNRVGKLRAYGNAIVPQVAAEFIAAFMDTQ